MVGIRRGGRAVREDQMMNLGSVYMTRIAAGSTAACTTSAPAELTGTVATAVGRAFRMRCLCDSSRMRSAARAFMGTRVRLRMGELAPNSCTLLFSSLCGSNCLMGSRDSETGRITLKFQTGRGGKGCRFM